MFHIALYNRGRVMLTLDTVRCPGYRYARHVPRIGNGRRRGRITICFGNYPGQTLDTTILKYLTGKHAHSSARHRSIRLEAQRYLGAKIGRTPADVPGHHISYGLKYNICLLTFRACQLQAARKRESVDKFIVSAEAPTRPPLALKSTPLPSPRMIPAASGQPSPLQLPGLPSPPSTPAHTAAFQPIPPQAGWGQPRRHAMWSSRVGTETETLLDSSITAEEGAPGLVTMAARVREREC